jgi:hypothetical protein
MIGVTSVERNALHKLYSRLTIVLRVLTKRPKAFLRESGRYRI